MFVRHIPPPFEAASAFVPRSIGNVYVFHSMLKRLYVSLGVIQDATALWTVIHGQFPSTMTKCAAWAFNPSLRAMVDGWMTDIIELMSDPNVGRTFGFRLTDNKRVTAFFARRCNCGYKYDKNSPDHGLPFPEVLWHIMKIIMPMCGLYHENCWPTGANVNYYKTGLAAPFFTVTLF